MWFSPLHNFISIYCIKGVVQNKYKIDEERVIFQSAKAIM